MTYEMTFGTTRFLDDSCCCNLFSIRAGVKLCWLSSTIVVFHSIFSSAVLHYVLPAVLFIFTIPFYFSFTLAIFRKRGAPLVAFSAFLIFYLLLDMVIAVLEVLRAFEIVEKLKYSDRSTEEKQIYIHEVPSHVYNVALALLSMVTIVWSQLTFCRYFNYLQAVKHENHEKFEIESQKTEYSFMGSELDSLLK
ncbi:unnamed protein product, partial [Mesorhabditis belari]|uniref:Uncharacterized protein n=1 Tax=Mesorhabditis belari TaxID=2138241 RepID=A0AAF3FLH7_9BILA